MTDLSYERIVAPIRDAAYRKAREIGPVPEELDELAVRYAERAIKAVRDEHGFWHGEWQEEIHNCRIELWDCLEE